MRSSFVLVFALCVALVATGCGEGESASSNEPGGDDIGQDAGSLDAQGSEDTLSEPIAVPFAVDDYFSPSGFEGVGETGIEASSDCPSRPSDAVGECHAFTLNPTEESAGGGVWWQYPDGNSGDTDLEGRRIAPGAQTVRFHAWSQSGGENVSFKVGMEGIDSFSEGLDLVLTDTPTEYLIHIGQHEYEMVIGAFSWAIDSETSVSFFVDNITWSDVAPTELEGCLDPNADNHVPGATLDSGDCTYAVEFSVDMSCSQTNIPGTTEALPFETVYVTGTFCDWCDVGYPLADEDGDGIYQATFSFPAGEYEYTYQVDSFADKEVLTDDVASGYGSCAPANSGPFSAEYANRVLSVQTMPQTLETDTYGSCLSCGEEPPEITQSMVYFQVNTFEAKLENIAGVELCGIWSPGFAWESENVVCLPMMEKKNGVYLGGINLQTNIAYQYTYRWFTDESDPSTYVYEEMLPDDSCQVGGGNLNRVVFHGTEEVTLDEVCWGLCGPCFAGETPGCMLEGATNHNPDATVDDGSCLFAVTFQVDLSCQAWTANPEAHLNGSFNDWCGTCAPMNDEDEDGVFDLVLELPAGDHEFKYISTEWEVLDPIEQEACTVTSIEGDVTHTNRVVTVVDAAVMVPAAQPGSCEPCPVEEIPGCTDEEGLNFNDKATLDDGTCTYPVTFQVDMSCYGDFDSVFLNGEFNEWCGDCWMLTESEQEDGIYTLDMEAPLGEIEYKYMVDSTWEELSPFVDVLCTTTQPNTEFTNRLVNIEGPTLIDVVSPGSCEPCPIPVCGDGLCQGDETTETCLEDCPDPNAAQVTFNVEIGCAYPELSEGDIVYVMGLDNWEGGDDQIALQLSDDDNNGVWTGTWNGTSGDYEYVLSFGHWNSDEGYWNPWYGKEDLIDQDCATGAGNRVLSVDGVMEVNLTHSYCDQCPGDEPMTVCGDGQCEGDETTETCLIDCPDQSAAEPALCDDGVTQSDPTFNMGWGGCATYAPGAINHSLCDSDGAYKACPVECGACPTCWDSQEFDAGWGGCETYAPFEMNHGMCEVDGADIECPVACLTCEDSSFCGDDVCDDDEDFESCSYDCEAPSVQTEVEFSVDMGCSVPALEDGDVVYVMGMDAWGTPDQVAVELSDEDQDGVWKGIWSGEPGDYAYSLSFGDSMDPASWNPWLGQEDIKGQACADAEGFRLITAEGSMEVALTHGYCEGCPGPEPEEAHIDFSIDMTCPIPDMQWTQGGVVYVMGLDMWGVNFELAVTLHDEDKDGIWEGSWTGPAGDYEYVLSFGDWLAEEAVWSPWFGQEDISGQWCADPETGYRSITAEGVMQVDLTHSYCDGCPEAPPEGDNAIEFSVDMSCSNPTLTEGDVVYVMGLDQWETPDQIAAQLFDEDQDGTWTGSWEGPAGDYAYILSFPHWDPELSAWNSWYGKEDIGAQACSDEGGNRTVSVNGPLELSLAHSQCDGCGDESIETPGCTDPDASNTNPQATFDDGTCVYPLTFQVDMSCYGDFSNVFVNGAFNEWCGNCWAMTDDDLDGIYVFTTDVPKGGVEFKFTVDDTWEVLQPGDECTVTVDEFTNRYVEVTGPTTVASSAPGSCSGCD